MATSRRTREGERRQADEFPRAAIADEDIARRAYQRYEERGREPGHDVDDWLQAERELRRSVTFD